ncbi:MAG TPA: CusA/CzcA family heavy metal efflux RND transporter [Polyangiales bacterium]
MLSALISWSVRRRVAACLLTAGVAAFGLHGYLSTPIEAYPDVTNYQVNVISQLPGLAPEEIERQVTVPLERVLNGTPGMIGMRSESMFGLSLVFITFDDDVDVFKARMMVGERIRSANVPEGTEVGLGPEATPLGQVFQYRLASDRHDLYELRATEDWTVERTFKQVPGVADVVSFGGYVKEFHIEVIPSRLEAHGLTLEDVIEALQRSNMNTSGGFLRQGDQELTIRGIGLIAGANDIQHVVLKSDEGISVTVGDVARVVQSRTPRRGTVAINDQREAVEGFVLLRRGENPSLVLKGIHDKVKELNDKILPKGMKIEAFYDRTTLVSRTLSTVHHNLLEGFVLVVALVWLFLRTLRGSLIVAVVIPLALLFAFAGLYLLKMPANLISMGAIDFGILVDGAVVLVENVIHEMHHRRPDSRRALLGIIARSAVEVSRPTFYAMSIIIAALIPVFTLQRVEGRIFRPLALTYSIALVGALIFALTIVPALCAIVLRPKDSDVEEPKFLLTLRDLYARALTWLATRKRVAFAVGGVLLLLAGVVGAGLGTEFLPELDEGDFMIFIEMPPSVSLEQGQDLLVEMRRRILAFPEVMAALSEQGRPEDGTGDYGVNMSQTYVRLQPKEKWRTGMDKEKLQAEMRASLTEIPGIHYNFSGPIKDNVEEAVSGVRGKAVLKVFGTDFGVMHDTLEQAMLALHKVKGVVELNIYRETTVPQLQIQLDRMALAREGISMQDAQRTIQTALAGYIVTQVWQGEKLVPIRVMLPAGETIDQEHIATLLVPTPSGARVPLRDLADIQVKTGRATINRENNSKVMALKFNVEGRDMGSVIDDAIKAVASAVKVPDGNYLVWTGEFENQQRALARLKIIVPLSLLVVLGLLYSALGSGRSALSIVLVVPFAMTGGVFALALSGVTLSVSAIIGFIALLGQVSLMGLLVLSAIEAKRRGGASLRIAVVEGAASRLRAVLMTALLGMLGLIPMALSRGVGSETQRPFAVVIVGGMVTTLLVALLLLPPIYALLARRELKVNGESDLDFEMTGSSR